MCVCARPCVRARVRVCYYVYCIFKVQRLTDLSPNLCRAVDNRIQSYITSSSDSDLIPVRLFPAKISQNNNFSPALHFSRLFLENLGHGKWQQSRGCDGWLWVFLDTVKNRCYKYSVWDTYSVLILASTINVSETVFLCYLYS